MKKFSFGLICSVISVLFLTAMCDASHIDRQLDSIYEDEQEYSVENYVNNNNYDFSFEENKNIKDPKLIKIVNYQPISDKDYQKKLKEDEKDYNLQEQKFKSTYRGDAGYRIYRVTERLIRANNLDYINWRIAPSTDTSFNAYISDANLITVMSGVADSFKDNDDALAFIIAHEFAHQIYGHAKRSANLLKKVHYFKEGTIPYKSAMMAYHKKSRMMEYMADAEALILIKRAGYSLNRAVEVMSYFRELDDNGTDINRTHPNAKNRMASFIENAKFINPEWVEEGKYNIYNSTPLNVEGGMNYYSMIIIRDSNSKTFYKPEVMKTRITRIAYVSYLKGDMENAIKYFEKLSSIEPENYIPHLYLSYAYEYLYKITNDKKYITDAEREILKAKKCCSSSQYVKQQIKDLENL